jgi:hypothetical protein
LNLTTILTASVVFPHHRGNDESERARCSISKIPAIPESDLRWGKKYLLWMMSGLGRTITAVQNVFAQRWSSIQLCFAFLTLAEPVGSSRPIIFADLSVL